MCWRAGVAPEEVVSQLKKVRTCPAYRTRHLLKGDTSKGTSCPSALGFAIEELCNKIHDRCFADEETNANIVESDSNIQRQETTVTTQPTPKAKCPECGADIRFEGSCEVCGECGWSRCD